MKQLWTIILAASLLALTLCFLPQDAKAAVLGTGSCGENATWTLEDTGTLTITGTGAMEDYYGLSSPWYRKNGTITNIIISDGITTIGNYAFEYCENLTFVSIPNSVFSIGEGAFRGNTTLTTFTIPNSILYIGDGAFSDCSALTSIVLPDSVTEIYDSAFWGCASLTSVTIPASVTFLGEEVFYNCPSLDGIWVDENNEYYSTDNSGVLYNKEKTTLIQAPMVLSGTYTVPNSVTVIGESAFCNCADLEEITIGEKVRNIENSAFKNCTGLTCVAIPGSVTSIGVDVFYDCTALTTVTIADSVTTVGHQAFYGCTSLTSVTLPAKLKTIDPKMFYNCDKLTSITIPDLVSTVGDYAFYGCASLTTISIPSRLTSISTNAFHGCTGLTGFVVDSLNSKYRSDTYGVLYSRQSLAGKLTTLIQAPYTLPDGYVIPDGLITICDYAFSGCTALTSITVPNSVNTIGEGAFSGCSNLESITLPFVGNESNSKTENTFYPLGYIFGYNSYPGGIATKQHFFYCNHPQTSTYYLPEKLKSVTVTEDDYLYGAFSDCTVLSSVTLPESMTYLGAYAFYNNTALTSVTIPDSITNIGAYAFSGCTNLSSLSISKSVTTIDTYAFADCTALTSISLPDTLTSVESYTFYNCTGLASVTIPDSVTNVRYAAFYGCTALQTVCYNGTEEQKASITIEKKNEPLTDLLFPVAIVPTITPKYPSLSFEDEVYISVYFQVSDMTDVVDLGLVVSSDETVDENDTMVTEYDYKASGDMCSVRTHGIPAKSLGETIYFKVYAKLSDGSYVYSGVYNYSALAYAQDRIANSSNENLKKLCVAMLNYGAAAQTYMGYNVDSLANATLTADQLAMVEGYNSSMIASVTAVDSDKMGVFTRSGFGKCYPSISFEGAFSISYYFTPSYTPDNGMKLYYWDKEAFDGVDVLTVDNATGVLDMTASGTAYKGAVEGIAAKEVDETIFVAGVYESDGVTYCTGVLPYSLGAYCVDRAANGSAAMIPLAEATAVYGYYAKQYFA